MKLKIVFPAIAAFCLFQLSLYGEDICYNSKIPRYKDKTETNAVKPINNNDASKIPLNEKMETLPDQTPNCCMKKYPDDYQVLQSARSCKDKYCGPYIEVTGLVWQSKEGNLEYASKFKTIDASDINSLKKHYIAIPDFAWRPGFKLDAGYMFKEDNWDIKTLWTYYRGEFTHVKKHTNVELYPEDNGVVPLFFVSSFKDEVSPSPRFTHATGDWFMYFNSIDCEIARKFFVRRKLSVRLLFGGKGAWINHEYRIDYRDGNTLVGPRDNVTYLTSYVNYKNKSWGFGPRMGFESKCHLIWGFKLLANTSVSALMTHFDVKGKQHDTIIDHLDSDMAIIIPYRTKNNFYTIKPNIQLMLGFEWSHCFNQSFFGLSAGYEMQYFFGQNQIKRPVGSKTSGQDYYSRGDLQLHGLAASLRYEF